MKPEHILTGMGIWKCLVFISTIHVIFPAMMPMNRSMYTDVSKSALNLPRTDINFLYRELKYIIKKKIQPGKITCFVLVS